MLQVILILFVASSLLLLVPNPLIGLLLTRLINRSLPPDEFITIRSASISFLRGRIYFRRVRWATENTVLQFHHGHLIIRWWRRTVREGIDVHPNAPCRLEMYCRHAEYLVMNNGFRYQQAVQDLRRRGIHVPDAVANFWPLDKPKRPPGREPQPEGAEPRSGEEASTMATGAADSDVVAVDDDAPASAGAADANATTPTPPMVPVAEYERSWFQRFSPAFCIRVRQGSMLIGSSTLPVLMSFNFGRVDGITTTIPARSPSLDYYRTLWKFDFSDYSMNWVPNKSFLARKRAEREGVQPVPNPEPGRRQADVRKVGIACLSVDNWIYDTTSPMEQEWAELEPYIPTNCSISKQIMTCDHAEFTWMRDEEGPVTPECLVFDWNTAPEAQCEFTCRNTQWYWGPWSDNQRFLITRAFFPYQYGEEKELQPKLGDKRELAYLQVRIKYIDGFNAKMIYRQDKDKHLDASQRTPSFLAVESDGGDFFYEIPYVTQRFEDGQHMKSMLDLENCRWITSVMESKFMDFARWRVDVDIHNPSRWNDLVTWNVDVKMTRGKLAYLYDHTQLFKDLVSDWNSFDPPPRRELFVPANYLVDLEFKDIEILLNVNDENVQYNINELDQNSYLVLAAPVAGCKIGMSVMEFGDPVTVVSVSLSGDNGAMMLRYPVWNTVREHMELVDEGAWDQPRGYSLMNVDRAEIDVKYSYYDKFYPGVKDVAEVRVRVRNPVATLHGHFDRYVINFKNNYAGLSQHLKPLFEYREKEMLKRKQQQQQGTSAAAPAEQPQEAVVIAIPEKEPDNELEVSLELSMGPMKAWLPLRLYNNEHRGCATFDELSLTLLINRSHLVTDIRINPMTVRFPSTSIERNFPIAQKLDLGNRAEVNVDGLNIGIKILFGVYPGLENYCENYDVTIGAVTGHGFPSQLAEAILFLRQFGYGLANEDNQMEPRLPDGPILLNLNLKMQSINVYLWCKESVTEITLAEGLTVSTDTVINALYNLRARIQLPMIRARHLKPAGDTSQLQVWDEMASFTWALNISVFVKDPAWQDASVKQMDYLRTQDSNTHRVPFDELPNMNRRLTLESSETDSESIVESPRPKHLRQFVTSVLAPVENREEVPMVFENPLNIHHPLAWPATNVFEPNDNSTTPVPKQYSSYQYITNSKRKHKQKLAYTDATLATEGVATGGTSESSAPTAPPGTVQPTDANTEGVSIIIDAQQDLNAAITPYFIGVLDDTIAIFTKPYTTEFEAMEPPQVQWLDSVVDEVLDDLQLASIKERFTVKPHQFSRTQLSLNMHLVNVQLIQEEERSSNRALDTSFPPLRLANLTQVNIRNLEVSLSLVEKSVQKEHDEDEHDGTLNTSTLVPQPKVFNKQEFYNVAFSVDVGDAHLAISSVNNRFAGLPSQVLTRELFPLHNRGYPSQADEVPVLLVLGCRSIYVTGKYLEQNPLEHNGVVLRVGDILAYSAYEAPSLLYDIAQGWMKPGLSFAATSATFGTLGSARLHALASTILHQWASYPEHASDPMSDLLPIDTDTMGVGLTAVMHRAATREVHKLRRLLRQLRRSGKWAEGGLRKMHNTVLQYLHEGLPANDRVRTAVLEILKCPAKELVLDVLEKLSKNPTFLPRTVATTTMDLKCDGSLVSSAVSVHVIGADLSDSTLQISPIDVRVKAIRILTDDANIDNAINSLHLDVTGVCRSVELGVGPPFMEWVTSLTETIKNAGGNNSQQESQMAQQDMQPDTAPSSPRRMRGITLMRPEEGILDVEVSSLLPESSNLLRLVMAEASTHPSVLELQLVDHSALARPHDSSSGAAAAAAAKVKTGGKKKKGAMKRKSGQKPERAAAAPELVIGSRSVKELDVVVVGYLTMERMELVASSTHTNIGLRLGGMQLSINQNEKEMHHRVADEEAELVLQVIRGVLMNLAVADLRMSSPTPLGSLSSSGGSSSSSSSGCTSKSTTTHHHSRHSRHRHRHHRSSGPQAAASPTRNLWEQGVDESLFTFRIDGILLNELSYITDKPGDDATEPPPTIHNFMLTVAGVRFPLDISKAVLLTKFIEEWFPPDKMRQVSTAPPSTIERPSSPPSASTAPTFATTTSTSTATRSVGRHKAVPSIASPTVTIASPPTSGDAPAASTMSSSSTTTPAAAAEAAAAATTPAPIHLFRVTLDIREGYIRISDREAASFFNYQIPRITGAASHSQSKELGHVINWTLQVTNHHIGLAGGVVSSTSKPSIFTLPRLGASGSVRISSAEAASATATPSTTVSSVPLAVDVVAHVEVGKVSNTLDVDLFNNILAVLQEIEREAKQLVRVYNSVARRFAPPESTNDAGVGGEQVVEPVVSESDTGSESSSDEGLEEAADVGAATAAGSSYIALTVQCTAHVGGIDLLCTSPNDTITYRTGVLDANLNVKPVPATNELQIKWRIDVTGMSLELIGLLEDDESIESDSAPLLSKSATAAKRSGHSRANSTSRPVVGDASSSTTPTKGPLFCHSHVITRITARNYIDNQEDAQDSEAPQNTITTVSSIRQMRDNEEAEAATADSNKTSIWIIVRNTTATFRPSTFDRMFLVTLHYFDQYRLFQEHMRKRHASHHHSRHSASLEGSTGLNSPALERASIATAVTTTTTATATATATTTSTSSSSSGAASSRPGAPSSKSSSKTVPTTATSASGGPGRSSSQQRQRGRPGQAAATARPAAAAVEPKSHSIVSIAVRVIDTGVCIPLSPLTDEDQLLPDGSRPVTKCASALFLSLQSFVLLGTATATRIGMHYRILDSSAKKVTGLCQINKLAATLVSNFTQDTESMSKLIRESVPLVNRACLHRGSLRMVVMLPKKELSLAMSVSSSGVVVDINSDIAHYLASFNRLLLAGQAKWKTFAGKLEQGRAGLEQQSSPQPAASSAGAGAKQKQQAGTGAADSPAPSDADTEESRLRIEIALDTAIGIVTLHRLEPLDPNDTSSQIDDAPSISARTNTRHQRDRDQARHRNRGLATSGGSGTSMDATSLLTDYSYSSDWRSQTRLDAFQCPPVSVRISHKYVPPKSKSKVKGPLSSSSSSSDRNMDERGKVMETRVMTSIAGGELVISKGTLEFAQEIMRQVRELNLFSSSVTDDEEPLGTASQSAEDLSTASSTSSSSSSLPPASGGDESFDFAALNASLGALTVAIYVKPQVVKLMCTPLTDVVCMMQLGEVEAMISTMRRSSDTPSARAGISPSSPTPVADEMYMYNATFCSSGAVVKIHHPRFPEDAVGLIVNDVQANVGLSKARGKKLSISVLLPVKEIKVLFSVMQLKEFFLFQQIWMAGLGLHSMPDEDERKSTPNVGAVPPPTTPDDSKASTSSNPLVIVAAAKEAPKLKEYISVFLLLSLNSVVVENNLGQSIGKATLNVSNTALRVAFPGKKSSKKKSVPRTIFSFEAAVKKISLFSVGALQGRAHITRLMLLGGRHCVPPARPLNQASFSIGSAGIELEYNLSPILFLSCGTTIIRFRDYLGSADALMVESEVVLPTLDVRVASESISAVGSVVIMIYDKVSEYHSSAIHKAKTAFSQQRARHHAKVPVEALKGLSKEERRALKESRRQERQDRQETLQKRLLKSRAVGSGSPALATSTCSSGSASSTTSSERQSPTETLLAQVMRIVPIGNLTVQGQSLRISVYGYSLRDPSWVSFSINSAKIKLVQNYKKEKEEVHRQLSIGVANCEINKMTSNEQVTEATNNIIFSIPHATILLYTLQNLPGADVPDLNNIGYWFVTEFNEPIFISVNLSLYSYFKDTIMLYIDASRETLKSVNRMKAAAELMYKRPLDSRVPEEVEVPPPEPDPRVFIEKKFVLEPRISVLGDQTPKVSTVLGWVGISDHHLIPTKMQVLLIDNLEMVLKAVGFVSDMLDSQSMLS